MVNVVLVNMIIVNVNSIRVLSDFTFNPLIAFYNLGGIDWGVNS